MGENRGRSRSPDRGRTLGRMLSLPGVLIDLHPSSLEPFPLSEIDHGLRLSRVGNYFVRPFQAAAGIFRGGFIHESSGLADRP